VRESLCFTELEDIKIPQELIPKKIKPSPTTRNVNAIHHGTDKSQIHITPPTAHAPVLNNPPPLYPRQSRRRGEQGKVVLAAEIASNGRALQALVNISSGYPRLDQAALESVLKWRFIPGKKAGVPQVMWINIPINFVLE
jgi:TonB family protein